MVLQYLLTMIGVTSHPYCFSNGNLISVFVYIPCVLCSIMEKVTISAIKNSILDYETRLKFKKCGRHTPLFSFQGKRQSRLVFFRLNYVLFIERESAPAQ